MEIWTAFILGLLGSFHCAGMCGPLVLALPAWGSRYNLLVSRLAYNLGRLSVYMLLGMGFGLFGKSLSLATAQRWLSLGTGIAILATLLVSRRKSWNGLLITFVSQLKKPFAGLMKQSNLRALFLLGSFNGFLPCGLVYVACATAATLASPIRSSLYMAAFGLGTVPMMLALGLSGKPLQASLRFRFQRLIPFAICLLGVMLVLRGLSLGIPYLSPDLDGVDPRCH